MAKINDLVSYSSSLNYLFKSSRFRYAAFQIYRRVQHIFLLTNPIQKQSMLPEFQRLLIKDAEIMKRIIIVPSPAHIGI